jgi:hypothetical protein
MCLFKALAAWSIGVVSACGVMGREIESRQGTRWQILNIKNNRLVQIKLPVSLFTGK